MPGVLKNKFLCLLLALVAFFLITPFIVDSMVDMYVFGLLFTIILLASVYVITHNRWLILTGIILASLIFIGLWLNNLFIENRGFLAVEYILMTLYFLMITVIVLRTVIKDNVISYNTIFGAICGYLLIGLVWSFFYSMVYFFQAGAFNFPDVRFVVFDSNFQQFTYYSFVTLTTLGYGDITPISNIAKTLAWIEAIVGQVYLTVWIAQLVGLHITQRSQNKGVKD